MFLNRTKKWQRVQGVPLPQGTSPLAKETKGKRRVETNNIFFKTFTIVNFFNSGVLNTLVSLARLELATPGFEVQCSIQLSYRDPLIL